MIDPASKKKGMANKEKESVEVTICWITPMIGSPARKMTTRADIPMAKAMGILMRINKIMQPKRSAVSI